MLIAEHMRITVDGGFGPVGADIEQWAFTVKCPQSFFTAAADRLAAANDCQAAVVGRLTPLYGNVLTFRKVRLAEVGPDGRVLREPDGSYRQSDSTTAVAAGIKAVTSVPATVVALVASIGTPRPGPTGKGRFFLPMPHFPLGTQTYELSLADTTTIATAVKGLLADFEGIVGGIGVVSSKGYSSPYTSLRVGRRPDTQRSRGGAMLENYVTL